MSQKHVQADANTARWRVGAGTGSNAAGLVFENISHDYDGVISVQDMDLSIASGEILCLIGHSGCGKTTLMRIAAGVERQNRGSVAINGSIVANDDMFLAPEKRGVGLMFQDYALFPHLSILANVMFGLTALPRSEAELAAMAALERVGLTSYAADYPHALSGGEQQRVALARALVPRPGVLLMDEPFSGLDTRLRDSVRDQTLAVIGETRATCIIVTHDPEEAMRMGDKIALMRSGCLVQHGTPEELYNRPADLFSARFFSELNQVRGRVTSAGLETPLGVLSADNLQMGELADVCIRPQGILLGKTKADGVTGKVVDKRFVGEVDLLTIVIEGASDLLQARVRAGTSWVAGMDVSITTDPKDVLVFPHQRTQV